VKNNYLVRHVSPDGRVTESSIYYRNVKTPPVQISVGSKLVYCPTRKKDVEDYGRPCIVISTSLRKTDKELHIIPTIRFLDDNGGSRPVRFVDLSYTVDLSPEAKADS
jgi:hypothetical protein